MSRLTSKFVEKYVVVPPPPTPFSRQTTEVVLAPEEKKNTTISSADKQLGRLIRMKKEKRPSRRKDRKRRENVRESGGMKSMMEPATIRKLASMDTGISRSLLGNVMYKFRCTYTLSNTSTAGGVVAGAFKMDPTDVTWTQFSSLSTLFDEFRVVGGRVTILPGISYATTTLSQATGILSIAFDNDSQSAPANHGEVFEYGTAKCFVVGAEKFEYSWKRPDITPSAYWVDCGAPTTSLGAVITYSNRFDASKYVYDEFWEMDVEFRSTR